jgi:hypothetical protein
VARPRFLVPVLLAALVALLLVGPALAKNVFVSGHYKGTTEQGLPISFKATRHQVRNLRFTSVAICESGKGSEGDIVVRHTPIKNTRFVFRGVGDNGATHVTIKGRLVGPYAGGTIVDRTEVNPEKEGEPEPGGTDHCKIQEHWAAEIP